MARKTVDYSEFAQSVSVYQRAATPCAAPLQIDFSFTALKLFFDRGFEALDTETQPDGIFTIIFIERLSTTRAEHMFWPLFLFFWRHDGWYR